mgnify:CR=1 FL=1
MRENVIETIKKEKLIAIVRGIAPEKCLKVAGALYAGGFRLVEITFDQKNPLGNHRRRDQGRQRGVQRNYGGRRGHSDLRCAC